MKHAKSAAATAKPFDDCAISLADDAPRVAPGEYRARVIACRRQWRFGRELLAFQFRLVSPGPFIGAVLPGYCNIGGDGHHEIPARSKLGRWVRLIKEFDRAISSTRIPLRLFSRYQFVVSVDLTRLDCNRRLLALHLQYPTVQDIVRVAGKCKNAKNTKKKRPISSHPIPSHLCKVESHDTKGKP